MLSVSSGMRRARISATRPPASATVRRTVPAIPWSTDPTKTTPTDFPSSRPSTSSGYAVPAKESSASPRTSAEDACSTAVSRSARSSSILAWRFARSASFTKPLPDRPTPTKIPITRATKTAASDATW